MKAVTPGGKLVALAVLAAASVLQTSTCVAAQPATVTLGVDVLLEAGSPHMERLAGKRVGLITNPSGVDGKLVPTIDRLAADPRLSLVRLFGPEHGIRGEIPAGETVADAVDRRTGVPIISLYGANKRPSQDALRDIDALLFDIQDVGSRTYTYISTLGEALHACAESRVPLVVLDRPNPLGGLRFEGPLIEERFRSFIGWGPVPLTHGMTLGEVSRYFNAALGIGCELQVVPMRGWRRWMSWDDTGLLWTLTSPHVPTSTQALLYTTTGMVATTLQDVNEGVGSTMPFEIIGAGFIDAERLAQELDALQLPGLRLQAIHYKPFYGKYAGRTLHGVRLRVTEPRAYRPLHTAVSIIATLRKLYPRQARFADERTLGTHWGDPTLPALLDAGLSPDAISAAWEQETRAFGEARRAALLYD